jgi:hypothetical protein
VALRRTTVRAHFGKGRELSWLLACMCLAGLGKPCGCCNCDGFSRLSTTTAVCGLECCNIWLELLGAATVTSNKGTTIPVQAKAMLGEAYVARQTPVQPQTGPKALACGSDPGYGLTRKGSGLASGAQSRSGAGLNTDWRSMPGVLPCVPGGQ